MTNNITRKECEQNKNILMKEIKDIRKDVNDIKIKIAELPEQLMEKLDERFVSKDSFRPIQKLVYSLVGAVLLGVVGAVLALIFK